MPFKRRSFPTWVPDRTAIVAARLSLFISIGAIIGAIYGGISGATGAAAQGGSGLDIAFAGAWGALTGLAIGSIDLSEGVGTLALIGAGSSLVGDLFGQEFGLVNRVVSGELPYDCAHLDWGELDDRR
jgi:hypothetical protein